MLALNGGHNSKIARSALAERRNEKRAKKRTTMKLRQHPAIKDRWALLIWNAGSYGRGDKFSTEPAGLEIGILKDAELIFGPGNGLRLIREYDGKIQTTVLELPDYQLRLKLCDVLKSAKDKPLDEVGDLQVDQYFNPI
jgi:hypothetical protein